jgi:hypothetical protein
MEFTNTNKVYRKSGGSPTIAFAMRKEKIPLERNDSPITQTGLDFVMVVLTQT